MTPLRYIDLEFSIELKELTPSVPSFFPPDFVQFGKKTCASSYFRFLREHNPGLSILDESLTVLPRP